MARRYARTKPGGNPTRRVMSGQRHARDSLQTVAMVGSYAPRRCGIGTFTADLAESIAAANPSLNTWAVALNDRPEGYRYPPRVYFEINESRLGEYRLAADFLNLSNVDVCCLQHEFGLFGGRQGNYVLELLRRLRMPVVTTLHTVLKEPDADQREVTHQLAEASDRLVVMAERAYDFLTDIYGIDREKIALIPHGIPDVSFVDPNYYKDEFDVAGRKVALTFGLLSPNKGIEVMIDALPKIVERHPELVYIVLGATHPGIVANSGEDYRLSLQRRAEQHGVRDHIVFVNRFVETDELLEFLGAADVYVTPYLNEAQITSGTLAYALGAGKATVSTPYWHAQEMLADGRGMLVPFKEPDKLAEAVNYLLENETERHAMRKRAYHHTRAMRWSETAKRYLELFQQVREQREQSPKPMTEGRSLHQRGADLTEIKLDHLMALTDDVGVFHRAKATVPDRHHGYRTENNAMALIAVLMAQDHLNDLSTGRKLDALACRYLSFLDYALDSSDRFRAQLEYDRHWRDEPSPEDTHGIVVWALGEAVARCQVRGHMELAASLFQRALETCDKLTHPHAWAYSLIGIHAYLRRFSGDSHARRARENLADRLFQQFKDHASDDWPWLTDQVDYAAPRLPHALLLSGRWMFNDEMIQVALRSLEWLHDVQTAQDGQFAPVGSDGWYPRGGEKARFDQRPSDAAAAIDAALEAYRITNDDKWRARAHRCLNWFLGDNDLHLPLYNHNTGGCHDALLPHGVDENQSAEATLAWLLSLLSLYEHTFDALNVDANGERTARPTKPAAPPQRQTHETSAESR